MNFIDNFSIFSVNKSGFHSRCEPGVFAEPVLEWNLVFCLAIENSLRNSKKNTIVQNDYL